MHEVGIAKSILEAVRRRCGHTRSAAGEGRGKGGRACAGVDRDSLSFCFEAITKGTLFEPMILALEDAPADELELSYLELEEP